MKAQSWISMLLGAVLVGSLLFGSWTSRAEPLEEEGEGALPLEEMKVERRFGESEGRLLLGLRAPADKTFDESCIPRSRWTVLLVEKSTEGEYEAIAEDVGLAAYASDGAIVFVRGEALYELLDGERRLLASPVLSDFSIHPDGTLLVISRPGEEPDSRLELIDRGGRLVRRLDPGSGINSLPAFLPGGESLLFVSGASGVASFWIADLEEDSPPRLLTNLESVPGALGEDFVPVPNGRSAMRFVDDSTLLFDAGDGLWTLHTTTGSARRLEGAQ